MDHLGYFIYDRAYFSKAVGDKICDLRIVREEILKECVQLLDVPGHLVGEVDHALCHARNYSHANPHDCRKNYDIRDSHRKRACRDLTAA